MKLPAARAAEACVMAGSVAGGIERSSNCSMTPVGDGQDFADIEAYGVQRWLGELALARHDAVTMMHRLTRS